MPKSTQTLQTGHPARGWGTVVITGASAGVGRATAHRFARYGARVGLIARDHRALNQVKAELESLGARAFCAPADVADAEEVFGAAKAIENAIGPIEVWVNDAMVTVFSPISKMLPSEFRRVTDVTYLGAVHGTMAALRHMRPRNRGTIVQVGSGLAYRGIPLQSAYCGAKHALRGFTNSIRAELIHDGSAINLTIVELPAVNTPQFDWARTHMTHCPRPVPPVIEPEAAAAAIVQAASGGRREYWLGLSTVKVILANMLGPGILDRYLAENAYQAQATEQRVPSRRRDNLDRPVHGLHRVRGRFDRESASWALPFPGPIVRILAPIGAWVLAAGFGFAAGRATHSKRRSISQQNPPRVRPRPDLTTHDSRHR
jgi:short-subunit dehydrogenase